MNRLSRGLLVAGLILALWWIPVPDGLTLQAWRLFAIFAATILGFILQPLPLGAVALAGVTLSTLTGILKPGQALAHRFCFSFCQGLHQDRSRTTDCLSAYCLVWQQQLKACIYSGTQ